MGTSYTVQSGDNLWGIVQQQFGLTSNSEIASKVNEIVAANNIENGANIFVGQVLNFDFTSEDELVQLDFDEETACSEESSSAESDVEQVVPEKTELESSLDSFFSNSSALDSLDYNSDGVISDDELSKFSDEISDYDSNLEDFTTDELKTALSEYSNDFTNLFESSNNTDSNAVSATQVQETGSTSSASSPVSVSSDVSSIAASSPVSDTSFYSDIQSGSSQEVTSESIQNEITQKENEKTSVIEQADADVENKNVELREAIITEMENAEISQEIQDEFEERDKEFDANIKEKESSMLEQETKIQDLTATIDAKSNAISDLEGQKSSLEGAISSINSEDEDADEQRSSLEENIANVQASIDEAQSALDEAQSALVEAKDAQLVLEEEKALLEEEKANLLADMAEEYEELNVVLEAVKELQEATQNEIQEITDAKTEKVATLDADIQALKTELANIKERENTEKVISENSVYDSSSSMIAGCSIEEFAAKTGYDAAFLERVCSASVEIGCSPESLLGLMFSESGLNSQAVNSSGGAVGLIQFMPSTAESLGTTSEALLNMSDVEQMDYVVKYFNELCSGYKDKMGDTLSAGDLYSLTFLPSRSANETLTTSDETYYSWNSGLDANGDGSITKTELDERIMDKFNSWVSSV